MTRHYLVQVPGDHPLDAEDLGELEAFALDRLHAEATVTEVTAPRSLASLAHYYSTHCLHDHHGLCKGICKHCPEPCKCDKCDHRKEA